MNELNVQSQQKYVKMEEETVHKIKGLRTCLKEHMAFSEM